MLDRILSIEVETIQLFKFASRSECHVCLWLGRKGLTHIDVPKTLPKLIE